ncbi:MAG: hypothetical protein IT182_01915 [Acidobacteria bacterium]|nr:hypothetical protein [Acidobacteriota bacterium]
MILPVSDVLGHQLPRLRPATRSRSRARLGPAPLTSEAVCHDFHVFRHVSRAKALMSAVGRGDGHEVLPAGQDRQRRAAAVWRPTT